VANAHMERAAGTIAMAIEDGARPRLIGNSRKGTSRHREDLNADLDGEEVLMSEKRESDERDYKFSQYFRASDGSDFRMVSYRTDGGYFFRIEKDSNETATMSGGPYGSRDVATTVGNRLLFEELNGEPKQPLEREDPLELGR
jgi:hypothetical protein